MASIIDVEGIGPSYASRLESISIDTTDELLEAGATKAGRKKLAEDSGIAESLILEWVNHCDLMRINGVGSEYADLLEEAGVDTVPELARRNAENLLAAIGSENNDGRAEVRRVPSVNMIQDWIDQAKDLPRVIEY